MKNCTWWAVLFMMMGIVLDFDQGVPLCGEDVQCPVFQAFCECSLCPLQATQLLALVETRGVVIFAFQATPLCLSITIDLKVSLLVR